jgi:hypothetical protein
MLGELILWAVLTGNDCHFLNRYSSDPNQRMQELLSESENLRQIQGEIEGFWTIDQPSHLTPDRTQEGGADGNSSWFQFPVIHGTFFTPRPCAENPNRKKITIRFTFSLSIGAEQPEQKPDPVRRMQENQDKVERFWMNDQPSHLTPDRTHGGVR